MLKKCLFTVCITLFTAALSCQEAPEAAVFVQLGHSEAAVSIAFSPDGKWIVSGAGDRTIKLWDAATGREIAQFIGFTDGEQIVITPDGYYKASRNGDKYLNVRIGNEVFGIDACKKTFYRPEVVEDRLAGP